MRRGEGAWPYPSQFLVRLFLRVTSKLFRELAVTRKQNLKWDVRHGRILGLPRALARSSIALFDTDVVCVGGVRETNQHEREGSHELMYVFQ